MKKIILVFVLVVWASYSYADELKMFKVNTDSMHFSCPCEFTESIKGVKEGSYGSGPLLLLIAPTQNPPHAIINLGKNDIELMAKGNNNYKCEVGEVYSSVWGNEDVEISTELKVIGPGAEACWFDGVITVKVKESATTVRVKGACGC